MKISILYENYAESQVIAKSKNWAIINPHHMDSLDDIEDIHGHITYDVYYKGKLFGRYLNTTGYKIIDFKPDDEFNTLLIKSGIVDTRQAYYYVDVIGGRWPEAEPIIKQNHIYAYYYARDVIKGRWPGAEPIIKQNPWYAYRYARDVIGGRWPEAEPIIIKDPIYAYRYAKYIIKGRWPEAEPYIKQNPIMWDEYKEAFNLI